VKLVWRPETTALTRLIPPYAAEHFSYPEVGATQRKDMPAGYHHVTRSIVLGSDRSTFDRAAEALTTWSMHRRAGLVVAASADRAATDVTTVMALGVGPVGIVIPCRVVWTVDEPDRKGFAYGTLPDHPECGEEAFIVDYNVGHVVLSIRAFSTPGERLVRAASGVARYTQTWMTDRYAQSLNELAHA
jgi:uncharacterized protein (UPF0548 family)